MQFPDRRTLLLGAMAASTLSLPALAAPPASRTLRFQVLRNGKLIGEHRMSFAVDGDAVAVATDASMVVKLGPVPVFRYRHHAEERWDGGRLMRLDTRTDSNGKVETVRANRTPTGVLIETAKGAITAPPAIAPLSHWNAAVLDGPLFNPQTGKLLKVSATARGRDQAVLASGARVPATRWSLTGEVQIDDWYDANGVWVALKGLLEDKSTMEYRRV